MSGSLGDLFERRSGIATELDSSKAPHIILDPFGIVKDLGSDSAEGGQRVFDGAEGMLKTTSDQAFRPANGLQRIWSESSLGTFHDEPGTYPQFGG